MLFGHHFAAISGAGPLIGPVLAAQFGYMPGLLWIVIGVCLAGAVQDFLVLGASLRRGGRSLTTIDAGTRIGRFLLQEVLGKVRAKWGEPGYWPAALLSTAVIVGAWAYFINAGSFAAIWAMFGVANQMLAVIALAVVSVYLVNEGRAKYLWVTAGPMIFVFCTTSTAACEILASQVSAVRMLLERSPMAGDRGLLVNALITGSLLVAMLARTLVIVGAAAKRVVLTQPRRSEWARAAAVG